MSGAGGRGTALGVAEAVAAAALWGSSGIFSVHLFRMGVPPESLALLRPVVGLALMVAGLALLRPAVLRVDGRGLFVLGLGGGAVVALFQLSYQRSIDAVGVPTTVALLYLSPPLVVAAAGPLLDEWPTRLRAVLSGVVVAGVWLSVWGADDVIPAFGGAGPWWGAVAAVGYAGYTLLGRVATPQWGSLAVAVYTTAGACVVLAVAVPAASGPVVLPGSTAAWALLVAYGAVTIALALFLFFDALGRIEAARVSIATTSEPVVAAVLATLLLGQGLSPVGWLGIAIVVLGVAGVTLSGRRPAPRT